ncbi:zinc transporter ZIP3 isoform X2 [Heterocephalus glaber]|uniref:Zinc transporter ZIP3 n=1 Tax=Heterocephalus glaber TaxID=10181 RepID=A0AAX6RSD5_HETGA|nr:zinc transporter ZIP3 isoform X2 [Heterocephalus glaber]
MVKLLVAKILCMVGVFFFMLLGSLLPVKVIETDFEKAHHSKKILSLCNTFGGGVFLATCFNALLPAVREKLQRVLSLGHLSTDYPLAETLLLLGFFVTVFLEQLVLTFRKEKPSFIDLETFNAGSDAGSDSEERHEQPPLCPFLPRVPRDSEASVSVCRPCRTQAVRWPSNRDCPPQHCSSVLSTPRAEQCPCPPPTPCEDLAPHPWGPGGTPGPELRQLVLQQGRPVTSAHSTSSGSSGCQAGGGHFTLGPGSGSEEVTLERHWRKSVSGKDPGAAVS